MLLKLQKGIKGGIYRSIYQHANANNKYMKDDNKNKESSYFQYQDVNNLHGSALSQKLPVNIFKWMSQFNKDFKNNI